MNLTAYANRRRAPAAPPQPRNAKAAQRAREQGLMLFVSFVGDTQWSNPTVYCDSGQRYDWEFARGLQTVLVVKPGIDARHAMREILERTETMVGYPVLIDAEQQEISCIVEGFPVGLWPVKRGSEIWQFYFAPP